MSKFVELIGVDENRIIVDAAEIIALRQNELDALHGTRVVSVFLRGGCMFQVQGKIKELQDMAEEARKPPQFELSAFESLQLAPGAILSTGLNAEALLAEAEDALRLLSSIVGLVDRTRETFTPPAPAKAMRGPA